MQIQKFLYLCLSLSLKIVSPLTLSLSLSPRCLDFPISLSSFSAARSPIARSVSRS